MLKSYKVPTKFLQSPQYSDYYKEFSIVRRAIVLGCDFFRKYTDTQIRIGTRWNIFFNSLPAKSVPAGTKLVLFGRYVPNIYVGIV